MGDDSAFEKSKVVTQLMALAMVEFDAGRIAKGTRLLIEATENAVSLEDLAAASKLESAIHRSTVVGDLRAIYGLGGIPRITRR